MDFFQLTLLINGVTCVVRSEETIIWKYNRKAFSLIEKATELTSQSNGEHLFWAGLMAFGERKFRASKRYFTQCLASKSPWPESGLFLHTLLKDNQPIKAKEYLDAFKALKI